MFLDVNEVNNQLQKNDDEIKLLERDIRQCHEESDKMLEEKGKTITLETGKLEKAQGQMNSSEEDLRNTSEIMEKLKEGIRVSMIHVYSYIVSCVRTCPEIIFTSKTYLRSLRIRGRSF